MVKRKIPWMFLTKIGFANVNIDRNAKVVSYGSSFFKNQEVDKIFFI